jgi:hypothetical protein
LVYAYERAELAKAGRQDLADRVEMVCKTIGDQAGFDIRSFDRNRFEEMHIEVKTTSGPASTAFFMTAAELEYAKSCALHYVIYRVHEYAPGSTEVRFFVIENAPDELEFTPALFRVRQRF